MSNHYKDPVFLLIKTLEKGEKKNFKLFIQRNSEKEDLKILLLFDLLDKMEVYNEALIFKKTTQIKKAQLSNLKANLYKQILNSLRIIKSQTNIDMQLHYMLDNARILYNKGLYIQSLKTLEKTKEIANIHYQQNVVQQVLFFEKKIEALFITRSMQNRAEILMHESVLCEQNLQSTSTLSNISLQLYSWFIQYGFARNKTDIAFVKNLLEEVNNFDVHKFSNFYQFVHYYQCKVWASYILQNFIDYYKYAHKWVQLFDVYKDMLQHECAMYIKGLHNLLNAYFLLGKYKELNNTLNIFEKQLATDLFKQNFNNQVIGFQYFYLSKIDFYFLQGRFTYGLKIIPTLEKQLKTYEVYLDTHRIMVFYYKIACLYFGSGNYDKAIDYLHKIINQKAHLRNDLQCYARLLHLIAHYELKNYDILESLIKSVYRFMGNMDNLSTVELAIFDFIRKSFSYNILHLEEAFVSLHKKLNNLKSKKVENRSFVYLDVLSWLESKIQKIPVEIVIKKKFESKVKNNI